MGDEYVTAQSWLAPTGRPDLIDVVADEFERRPLLPVAEDVRQAA